MPRNKVSRDLGPLPRSAQPLAQGKSDSLLQILKSLALKNQREQPRVFYSLREVAKQFKVPVSTIARIYGDLENEGLLSRVRGSKTILNGLRYNRRRVRAFIGLPAVLSNFITLPEYRRFFICIRRELWLRGFASTMVFFRPEEAADGTLSDQLKSYKVDTVIWLQPGRSARESMLRLSDMGVRVIVISEVGTPGILSRYYVWKASGVEALVRTWKSSNPVCRVTIVNGKDYRSPVIEEVLHVLVDELGIEAVVKTFRNQAVPAFLRDLRRPRTDGIIFSCTALASMFSFQCPLAIIDLLRSVRVAFIDGWVDLPFAKIPDVLVDLVTFDWQAIAESIVNDVVTLDAFDCTRPTTFQSQVELRVPLSNFSEPILPLRGTGSA